MKKQIIKKIITKVSATFFGFLIIFVMTGLIAMPKVFAETIEMDGEFDDWEDVDVLITDSITDYPYSGTIYYFNNGTNAWQAGAIAGACMYTANRALDLGELKLTNDDNYLYILWERGSDFLNYYWRDGDATEESFFSDEAATSDNNNPCAGEIVTAPVNFDHDLILSVDKDQDGTYDYYLVINVVFSAGDFEGYDTAGYIYQDNGNGAYLEGEETLLTTFADHEYEVIPDVDTVNGMILQEVKMDIAEIFNKLDLNWGDSIDVKYEAHSETIDETDGEEYTFEEGDDGGDGGDKDIERAKARKFTSLTSGKENIRLVVYGSNFMRNDSVELGGKKPYKIHKRNDQEIVAYYRMSEVKKLGRKKLKVKLFGAEGGFMELDKKVDITDLKEWESWKNLNWVIGLR